MRRLVSYLRTHYSGHGSNDRELLARFLTQRDEAAFAELVHRHGTLVWGVCRRNLANAADAEDAFQATFLVLLRRADKLAARAALGPWLYQVAGWCCRNLRRVNQRRLSRVHLGLAEPVYAANVPEDKIFADLDSAVLSLPEKYRTPIILCHLQGWSRQQAAEYLGCLEGTLSARLSRALAKLRDKLAQRDPAAGLAIAGALAAPPALASAAVRAAIIYSTASGELPQNLLSTANGVLGMFRTKKLRLAATAMVAIIGVALLGANLTARPEPAEQPRPRQPAKAPALAAGRWMLVEWLSPHFPQRVTVITIANRDGQPAIQAIEEDTFKWKSKGFEIDGRRVRFTMTRDGKTDYRFDGLIDPNNANRVLGSIWAGAGRADRAELELLPANADGKPRKPALPVEWASYLDLSLKRAEAANKTNAPGFAKLSPSEQILVQIDVKRAEANYYKSVEPLFRKLIAEQPHSSFGCEAAMELFGMLARIKPTPAEVEEWANTARTFAATHGVQFEADTLKRIAEALIRQANYAELARKYATEADKLAKKAGMPATSVNVFNQYQEERTAWASQKTAPMAGMTWEVHVAGRVTDVKGEPIPDAEVFINNVQWVNVNLGDGSNKAKTGPDGRYKITLKCQGTYRAHITRVWADKRGFLRAENSERHKLLPDETATINFKLEQGELFGGTLKIRPNGFQRLPAQKDEIELLHIVGAGVDRYVTVANGGRFELTLPPGEYRVELDRFAKKPLVWTKKTGRSDYLFEQPEFQYTSEAVGAGFDEMWQLMDRTYSYFTLKPDIDWAKLRDEYRPKAIKAKSAAELAEVLKEMLGKLQDGHVWIEMPGGKIIGTHQTIWNYNGNRKFILDQLTDQTKCGDFAIVGKTKPDGFGYFLMTHQSSATPELTAKAVAAIEKLSDAPGFIVDLRTANGGNELLAQQIASLFCAKKVIYAKSRYRAGKKHDDFTEDRPRWLPPAKSGKPYLKPVVCLLGPGCISSGEGFAKMLAALPNVTTVGLPTRGSSGNPSPVELGDSGIVVYFSRWVDLLPDGTPVEGHGVPPRIRVESPRSAYAKSDPTLEKALEVLRAKAKGAD